MAEERKKVASKDYAVWVEAVGPYKGSYTEYDDGSIRIDTVFDAAGVQWADDEALEDLIEERILYPDRFDNEDDGEEEEHEDNEE